MSTAAQQQASNNITPFFRPRTVEGVDSLPASVDACLKGYFRELNGMSPAPGMYEKVISQVEKPLIEHVLKYVRGNQVRAAHILGINRNTLRKKISYLDIDIQALLNSH